MASSKNRQDFTELTRLPSNMCRRKTPPGSRSSFGAKVLAPSASNSAGVQRWPVPNEGVANAGTFRGEGGSGAGAMTQNFGSPAEPGHQLSLTSRLGLTNWR